MAPLEYLFMAGKAQEVQVGDINIGQGGRHWWQTAQGQWSQRWEGSTIQAM